jgi:hypothetical protein
MHSERIWIFLVVLGVIVIGSNLVMLSMVRGMRGFKVDFFKNFKDASQPWKNEDEGLRELSKRVSELKANKDGDDQEE